MIRETWARFQDSIWHAPEGDIPTVKSYAKRWAQIIDRSLRGFFSNDGLTYASALTYTSLLSLIPLLAVLLAVLKGFGYDEKAKQALRDLPIVSQAYVLKPKPTPFPLPADLQTSRSLNATAISSSTTRRVTAPGLLTPAVNSDDGDDDATTEKPVEAVSISEIIDNILNTVSSTNFKSLGLFGGAGLMLLVLSLLSKIEGAMNEAWAVYRSRSIGRKLADYMNWLMVMLLLLVGFSVLGTTKIVNWIHNHGLRSVPGVDQAGTILVHVISYMMVLGAFVFMYVYIPNTHVRWRSALAGGIAAWLAFFAMQFWFVHFQGQLLNSRLKIYGAFGSVLLLLFYVYLFWCIVLWGVEVSSAHQNIRDWRRRRRAWKGLPAERETLALRLAAVLARPLLGEPEISTTEIGLLADRLNVPPHPVAEMLELFRSRGLVVQSAEDCRYMMARSPENVSVLDVLRLVRQGVLESPPNASPRQTCESLSPMMAQNIKDLATQPLEAIHTFAI